jgi:ABC-type amino acid transport substrate-binding protein
MVVGIRKARSRSNWRWKALAAAVLAVSAQTTHAAQASDLASVKARGKLVVGVFATQDDLAVSANLTRMRERGLKLAELRHPDEFTGFDIDLLKGFAESLGVELEFHAATTELKDLFSTLTGGACDLLAGGLGITAKRREAMDFSRPYFTIWLAVITRRDSPISSVSDLAGKTAVEIAGSSAIETLRALAPRAKIELAPFSYEVFDLVAEGKADFTTQPNELAPGEPVGGAAPNLKVAFRLQEIPVGFAARKGSDLLAPLDAYLDRIRRSGELARILGRHGAPVAKASTPP